jgi:hypothetical protein
MKLKINKNFTKKLRIKIKNKRNEDQIRKYNMCKLRWKDKIENK